MKLYVATWPNGTISILTAQNKKDLFYKLDSEGDPGAAIIKEYNFGNEEDVYFTTELNETKDGNAISVDYSGEFTENVKVKKVKL